MSSYLSGLGQVPVGSIANGTAAAVLVGITAFGLNQIRIVFQRGITNILLDKVTKNNETLNALKTTISNKLGTLFVSTKASLEVHDKDVVAKDKDGKELKDDKGNPVIEAHKGDLKVSNTSLFVSGVTLCLVALAAFKLMSYWRSGDSPLNNVLPYFSPVQVAPSGTYTVFNTVGDTLSSLKTRFI